MEGPFGSIFVVLPPLTHNGSIIFGKNSDRPRGEVQELIYEPPKAYSAGESLKCTYIEVQQVENTNAVILSKPAWMWGCEMGANDQGVVIGCQAVLTKIVCTENKKGFLGTDLVRLALERCKTSEEGVDIIVKLLAEYGQSNCQSDAKNFTYQNSFLLADANEAWLLETAGFCWIAQKITSGFRNISNCFSIEEHFDKKSADLIDFAKENGFWNGEGEFNFAAAFNYDENESSKLSQKYFKGMELMKKFDDTNKFGMKNMFDILRNSDIFNTSSSPFPTAGSQVSMLLHKKPGCHWFTSTPDPVLSVFKPFIFTPDVKISIHTKSPVPNDMTDVDSAFDWRHNLYKLHANACSNANNKAIYLLQEMEQTCLKELEKFIEDFQEGQSLSEVDELLKDIVETEVKFYK